MLNVVTVETGNYLGRGAEYVAKLHDMVRRNLPEGFRGRFVVLTDDTRRYADQAGVEARSIDGPHSWWAKAHLFRPGQFMPGEQVLYFDLDTAITGPLEKLAAYPGAFAILRDVYRPNGYQSSVMAFRAGTKLTDSIWDELQQVAGAYGIPKEISFERACDELWPGGDQQFLEQFWAPRTELHPRGGYLAQRINGDPWPPDILQDHYPGVLRSYKVECVWGIPVATSVVFFHGDPRPHEVLTGWVPEVWKVGGGTAAELVQVGTVPQDQLLENVRRNLRTGLRQIGFVSIPNDYHAIIVGGGPSLPKYLGEIQLAQKRGALLFTVNGVEKYLREHGIEGNFHVMLDGRPEMAAMVCERGHKLYASIMDPELIATAASDKASRVTLWHPATDGMAALVPEGALIGGGTTVGCRAMVLAYAMGFRTITCVGFDSCYGPGGHHAYPQPLNDGERVLDCVIAGKRFKAAGWMVQQGRDWRNCARGLTQNGCRVYAMPDGLVGAIAADMAEEFVEIDGDWWPSSDTDAREAVISSLEDLGAYVKLCRGRKVAVQAGGNVGLWPRELARHFERVITFEPDPENFTCLERNITRRARGGGEIKPHQAAVGDFSGHAALELAVGNCGATRVIPAQEGPVDVCTIDSLGLPALDLLQLDVEGFELPALRGAEATILAHSPLIVVELKGHGEQYGYTDQELVDWLQQRGYRKIGVAHRDVIFQRETQA